MKKQRSLLGVQSIIGGLIVLAVLALYFIGGAAFEELKTAFHRAVTDDTLAQVLSQAWDTVGG